MKKETVKNIIIFVLSIVVLIGILPEYLNKYRLKSSNENFITENKDTKQLSLIFNNKISLNNFIENRIEDGREKRTHSNYQEAYRSWGGIRTTKFNINNKMIEVAEFPDINDYGRGNIPGLKPKDNKTYFADVTGNGEFDTQFWIMDNGVYWYDNSGRGIPDETLSIINR